ncbi:MAG: DUF2231 domain-containing protein [Gammaproteobacteria bacterium]|nr:DUF2231 domain-containing protein [Gammaproteobacteria bacterium]
MIEIIPNWHPIFVHFTVALLSIAIVLFVLGVFNKNESTQQTMYKVAEWNFWIGAIITIATGLAGWYAYNTVAHDTPSHAAMTVHRNWALATITVLTIIAFWLWRSKKTGQKSPSKLFVSLLVGLLLLLGTTAWHGGEVVYRYGLGVMSLPKSEGEGHAHEHPAGGGHGHDALDEKTNDQQDDGHAGHSNHKH